MLSRKALAIASLSTIVCSMAGGALAGEAFKSSQFLTYSAEARQSYITSSAMMAGLIASQNNPRQGKCIDDWIARQSAQGYASVVEVMKRYPDHHPSAVIVAVLDKACGSFKY